MVYDISVLCRLFGVTPNAIRYYEKIGLIHPAYSEGGRRKYSSLDICELVQVKTMQALGLDLVEIGDHFHRIPEKKLMETDALLRRRIADIDREIVLLQESRRILLGFIERMEETKPEAGIRQEMTFPAVRMLSYEPFWGRSAAQQQVLSQWIALIPTVRLMDEYLIEDERVVSHKAALSIREEIFKKTHMEASKETYIIPESQAVELRFLKPYTVQRCLDEADVAAVIREIHQFKSWSKIRIISSYLYTYFREDQPTNYIEVWACERT